MPLQDNIAELIGKKSFNLPLPCTNSVMGWSKWAEKSWASSTPPVKPGEMAPCSPGARKGWSQAEPGLCYSSAG